MSTSEPQSLPTPRAEVTAMPAYVPGRPPVPRDDVITYKLSSNENPYPPLPGVLEAAARACAVMNRYPDMGSVELRTALATKLGVELDQVAVGTGSVAILYHLLQAFCEPGDEVVLAWRSFEAYPIAITVAGATGVEVPLTADGRHDLPAMAAAVTERTRVVLLCTPNNPTGPALTRSEVEAFLAAVRSDVVVVIDEAYLEFVRSADPVDGVGLATSRGNVVVMRTFAKAYGLAGLRVGYLVGPAPIAEAVRACSLPFGVSSLAQAAAVASLDAEVELFERVASIVAERDRVVAGLADAGWTVPEAQGNFVWFELGDRTAEFVAAAEEAGIVVRPFAGEGVRVSIGEPDANDVLLKVAAALHPSRHGSGDSTP
ncbi:histidinol-phosphate transaminase [Nocardioides marmorisolisilvae]|uniref:Aromatic amino acid aminotransferase n=1 Tax=Nocardioides marmorisolisilvae TaxID=1542737 RepID=A0A3N0DQH1_9ACTN|nr:histidinol-phosphate transaminase [Nocardioides marmorisolisilvae]RNL77751.1 histidinol-phosphate transaminase [Nocardioides marmorisolisilvae]